jgi:hypothetical protein
MDAHLKEIAKIRVKNNDLWMKILDIALRSNPQETKSVLCQIRRNDVAVTDLMARMVDGEY